jgi:aryl-alcohol dehydrogenase-like predicted oxidoreductase
MQTRAYGASGLQLSVVGLGAGQIGEHARDETEIARFLNAALDMGVRFIDTAPSYGISEDRIGRHIAHRRHEYVLSTKLGYGVEGVPDWTGAVITAGIEQALRKMKCDHLDIAHLHSCPRATLEQTDVIDALDRAKRAGKVRAIAYSGENEDLAYAIECGRFDGFMASLNICDQRVIREALPRIAGRGFIAKRPVANYAWKHTTRPVGQYAEAYWLRFQAMELDANERDWGAASIRFALAFGEVTSTVVGTATMTHLEKSVAGAEEGALDAYDVAHLRKRFDENDSPQKNELNWQGQI